SQCQRQKAQKQTACLGRAARSRVQTSSATLRRGAQIKASAGSPGATGEILLPLPAPIPSVEGAAMRTIRKEMPAPQLDKDEFKRRYRERFYDPAFDSMQIEIDRLAEIAWDGYENSRKSPRTERAGEGFADPDYQLAIEWRETSRRVAD